MFDGALSIMLGTLPLSRKEEMIMDYCFACNFNATDTKVFIDSNILPRSTCNFSDQVALNKNFVVQVTFQTCETFQGEPTCSKLVCTFYVNSETHIILMARISLLQGDAYLLMVRISFLQGDAHYPHGEDLPCK